MNPYIAEIIDAHNAIENWLGQSEGDLDTLVSRFSHDFSMITPGGACLDHTALCHFFQTQRGSRGGLTIVVEDIALLAEWQDGAVLRYCEKQTLPGQAVSSRWSTVVFQRQSTKIVWRHLHETAQA